MNDDGPKCRKILELLESRSKKRLDALSIAHKVDKSRSLEVDSTFEFLQDFKKQCQELLDRVDVPENTQEDLMMELNALETLLSKKNSFLSPYDQKVAYAKLAECENKIRQKNLHETSKKFSFKNKITKRPHVDTAKETEMEHSCRLQDSVSESFIPNSVSDLRNETIVIGDEAGGSGVALTLKNLRDCNIRVKCIQNAIHMKNLQNCKILTFLVDGSIFVDDCCELEVVVTARQIRLCKVFGSSFYIFSSSRPTMEACRGVLFAPRHDVEVDEVEMRKFGFEPNKNLWSDVQDFDWPRPNSPNWGVLSVDRRRAMAEFYGLFGKTVSRG